MRSRTPARVPTPLHFFFGTLYQHIVFLCSLLILFFQITFPSRIPTAPLTKIYRKGEIKYFKVVSENVCKLEANVEEMASAVGYLTFRWYPRKRLTTGRQIRTRTMQPSLSIWLYYLESFFFISCFFPAFFPLCLFVLLGYTCGDLGTFVAICVQVYYEKIDVFKLYQIL